MPVTRNPKPGFVHKDRWLQNRWTALTPHSGTAQAPQFFVNKGSQFLESALIPGAPPDQKVAHIRTHVPLILVNRKELPWRLRRRFVVLNLRIVPPAVSIDRVQTAIVASWRLIPSV